MTHPQSDEFANGHTCDSPSQDNGLQTRALVIKRDKQDEENM
jgi:hypothetical protein